MYGSLRSASACLSWIDVPLCQAAIAFDKQADKIEAEEIKWNEKSVYGSA